MEDKDLAKHTGFSLASDQRLLVGMETALCLQCKLKAAWGETETVETVHGAVSIGVILGGLTLNSLVRGGHMFKACYNRTQLLTTFLPMLAMVSYQMAVAS